MYLNLFEAQRASDPSSGAFPSEEKRRKILTDDVLNPLVVFWLIWNLLIMEFLWRKSFNTHAQCATNQQRTVNLPNSLTEEKHIRFSLDESKFSLEGAKNTESRLLSITFSGVPCKVNPESRVAGVRFRAMFSAMGVIGKSGPYLVAGNWLASPFTASGEMNSVVLGMGVIWREFGDGVSKSFIWWRISTGVPLSLNPLSSGLKGIWSPGWEHALESFTLAVADTSSSYDGRKNFAKKLS